MHAFETRGRNIAKMQISVCKATPKASSFPVLLTFNILSHRFIVFFVLLKEVKPERIGGILCFSCDNLIPALYKLLSII